MPKLAPRVLISSLLLCAPLILLPQLAQAGEIKVVMRDMKHAMQGAMNSTTMPELSRYVARLESDVERASHQTYRDDQPTYDEGMRTLKQEFAAVDQAVRANDLSGAKQELRKINQSRKHYHDLLN